MCALSTKTKDVIFFQFFWLTGISRNSWVDRSLKKIFVIFGESSFFEKEKVIKLLNKNLGKNYIQEIKLN